MAWAGTKPQVACVENIEFISLTEQIDTTTPGGKNPDERDMIYLE
jgi:hypothetical protein